MKRILDWLMQALKGKPEMKEEYGVIRENTRQRWPEKQITKVR